MRIAVVGGTGVAGRHLLRQLAEGGHDAVALSRASGVDVVSGAGLEQALGGADVVVDVSGPRTVRRAVSVAWFGRATAQLLAHGERAGVRHHVVLSIVGLERVRSGYYAGKLRQEELALAGPLPVTLLRATQFHEFAGQVLARATAGPVAAVPRLRVQPVAAVEVARALAGAATGTPAGRLPDLGGPQEEDLVDLARQTVRARGDRTRVLALPSGGTADGLLPGPGARAAGPTFAQWLAAGG